MKQATRCVAIVTGAIAALTACSQSSNNTAATEQAPVAPVALLAVPTQCDTPTTPFCNAIPAVTLPAGWHGNVFHLSQAYPQTPPSGDAQPWLTYNPMTQPAQYIRSVLAYFYQGNVRSNVEQSFDPALNHTRAWYNAPWQDAGFNGREPIHGLTRERVSKPGELHRCQTSQWNNYAVGFYNGAGASAIAQIWADHGNPNPTAAAMPEGTVAAKLLFTTAPISQVPYLAGSPTWNAYIYSQVNSSNPAATRAVVPVRLLQIDIAVKDSRAPNGWVFGTFVYGGGPHDSPTAPCPSAGGASPVGSSWSNVAPVGLMWGNDPGHTGTAPLTESWLNPVVHMPHVGFQGRLNGPVDNPVSSCMSCHSTAQWPDAAPMIPNPTNPAPWFRDIPSNNPFTAGTAPLDYSLQIEVGIKNFRAVHAAASSAAPAAQRSAVLGELANPTPPRDGAPSH